MPDRVAFVYHLRYPATVGGAERFYDALARELARSRPVTLITRSFPGAPAPDGPVETVELCPARDDSRGFVARNLPKVEFAVTLFWHLLRHGRRYGAVHVCCFPHVGVIAACLGLMPHRRVLLLVDWHEVMPRARWRRRLGRMGDLGWLVQRLAVGAGDVAVTFSRLHERRLRDEGRRGRVEVLPEFPPDPRVPDAVAARAARERLIVFAGRLVAEKRAHLVPAVLAELRREDPSWHAVIFGDGSERERVERAAADAGGAEVMGFAPWEEISAVMLRAADLVFPTTREGFGLVVLEAAAHGLPVVLVREEDNAAVELVEAGAEGRVCEEPDPVTMAAAVRDLAADPESPARARDWYERGAERYSPEGVAERLVALHAGLR
ncbi:MAG TPA: glycosyltransferase family 4 protein [Thermoleophilaceae bacterium]|nr:glycosyltransferase family 4 protein [Thermoleophilaceae bacterium]